MKENTQIIAAIKAGEYKLSFEEPNNISVCTKYDGTKFYLLSDDDIKFGVSGGCSIVSVLGTDYYCNLGTGEWFIDEVDNGELLEDQDLIKALESIPDILKGEMLSPDKQMEVYFRANPDAEDLDYYWCEDENMPKDIEDLGWDDVEITVNYSADGCSNDIAEWEEMECSISDSDLYSLYLLIKDIQKTDTPFLNQEIIEVASEQLNENNKELYDCIIDQIADNIDNSNEEGSNIRFYLSLDIDVFEDNL
jgi:hypothetical protein